MHAQRLTIWWPWSVGSGERVVLLLLSPSIRSFPLFKLNLQNRIIKNINYSLCGQYFPIISFVFFIFSLYLLKNDKRNSNKKNKTFVSVHIAFFLSFHWFQLAATIIKERKPTNCPPAYIRDNHECCAVPTTAWSNRITPPMLAL